MVAQVIDARPMLRPWQAEVADHLQRFNVLVVHRRAGKTVFCCLWLLSRALARPDTVAVYVAPQRDQAKRIAFEILQANAPPGTQVNRSELMLRLPNNTRIYLLGTDRDNGDSIRGLKISAAVLDETAGISPYAWQAVIRPALADTQGDAIFIGTPQGKVGLFWDLYQRAADLPDWYRARYGWEDTGALQPDEVAALRREMSEARFRQELEVSFEAAIEGAYYGSLMDAAEQSGRVGTVPHDPKLPVTISMDLGFSDATSVWAWQFPPGGAIHAIWWREWQNTALPEIVRQIRAEAWDITTWILPHDGKVSELGSGRTRKGIMQELGCNVRIAPNQRVRDGIEAVRTLLPKMYFDREQCGDGVEYLKAYRSEYSEQRQVFGLQPLHDFTSHAADSVRYMAVTWHEGLAGRQEKPRYERFNRRMI